MPITSSTPCVASQETVLPIDLEFVSFVERKARPEVEELFFFNPRQSTYNEGILKTIERFGPPEIVEKRGRLRLTVRGGEAQCLFAVDSSRRPPKPIGVILYVRTSAEVISVAHLAADPDLGGGDNGFGGLGAIMIERLRQIAHQVKGIRRLELPYRRNCFLSVGTQA